jgi:hypothetical protein
MNANVKSVFFFHDLKFEPRRNIMKYKVGDTVRIQSQEWIDAQERDEHGNISLSACETCKIIMEMEKYAGKEASTLLELEVPV